MATSTISSLGVGSNGVLSQSVIDQLKAADTTVMITPIDNSITQNKTETNDLSILTTLVAGLKSTTSSLSDEITYLTTSATSSSSSVSVTASSGVSSQDFSINVTNLAKRDIYQSKSFANDTSTFTSTNDTLNFNIAGQDYAIDVTASTTISDLRDKIFDATNGKITASVLNVGGTTPYKLVLKSTDTGTNNAITVTSTGAGTAATDLGLNDPNNHIQSASDAAFTYNNVDITRSSNVVSDLTVGVTLNLNSIGQSNISIKQDTSGISDGITSFVSKYNDLINNLNTTTNYDTTTKVAGVFQGTSQVRDLKTAINTQLFSVDDKGRSIADYGVTLNSAGLLQIDNTVFDNKLSSNPADVEDFFRGSTNSVTNATTNGYFTNFNDLLSSYINSRTGILTQFNTELTNESTTLADSKQKATDSLDSKYQILTTKFAAYDTMIAKFNASFQSLSMQIQALTNTKTN